MTTPAAPAAPLLEVENLEAGYGPINVLHRLSLTVNKGEIVAMIGANGAGKTTTLMCLSGLVKARAGKIAFAGRDLVALVEVPGHGMRRGTRTAQQNRRAPAGRQLGLRGLDRLRVGLAGPERDRERLAHAVAGAEVIGVRVGDHVRPHRLAGQLAQDRPPRAPGAARSRRRRVRCVRWRARRAPSPA